MTKKPVRKGFSEWIDRQPDSHRGLLPLTHITKGLVARDILQSKTIEPVDCSVFGLPLSYFFYGRPAYRLMDGTSIKLEASCPFCFIFDGEMIKRARHIHAFDTGAFANRLFNHVLDADFNVDDFSLGTDHTRPNKLIDTVFPSVDSYLQGNRNYIAEPSVVAQPHEFEARAYLDLLRSPGRNEPDDRICSIEVTFGDLIPVPGQLIAIVAPHTLCDSAAQAPWLDDIRAMGIDILPYNFTPGRPPEHYHTLLEVVVHDYYIAKSFL